MIVCLCAGVPERAVLAALERGASRVEDLAEASGAGRDCGACLAFLEALIPESRPLVHA